MTLTLEVTGAEAETLGAARRKTFSEDGGTIGRVPAGVNHWLLEHSYVSKLHAVITFADGVFYIEDRNSANGIFLNRSKDKLDQGRKSPIKTGDTLFIEPFDICVSVSGREGDYAAPGGAFVPSDDSLFETSGGLTDFLKSGSDERRDRTSQRPRIETASPINDNIALPPVQPRRGTDTGSHGPSIPTGYNPLDSVFLKPALPPEPQVVSGHNAQRNSSVGEPGPTTSPRADAEGSGLTVVLSNAGVTNAAVTPAMAKDLGLILHTVVKGLIDVMKDRQDLKGELNVEQTRFRREGNNALKFSTTVPDALDKLLIKPVPGYLNAVESFEDAFSDLRYHQMAMLAGMRAAFEAMLHEFDPQRLEDDFDRRLKGAILTKPKRAWYWEQYREKVDAMIADANRTYSKLFQEAFAEAYEAQLERLKLNGRSDES